MKKLLKGLVCLLSFFAVFTSVLAADEKEPEKEPDKVNVYLFSREACPHCISATEYFNKLATDKEYGKMFNFVYLEVFDTQWNVKDEELEQSLYAVAKKMGDTFNGTPYIIVGEKSFTGWSEEAMADDIKKEIKRCYEEGYTDPMANLDAYVEPEDEDKSYKTLINVIVIGTAVGLVALVVFSRINDKKKDEEIKTIEENEKKKQAEMEKVIKEATKKETKEEKQDKPKAKKTNNKNKKQTNKK